jgi:hypothetical protein
MKQVYSYLSCGLTIRSEIELSELFAVDEVSEPQLSVKSADVNSGAVLNATVVKPYSRYSREEYFLEVPGVIRMLVKHGDTIVVQFLTKDTHFANQFIYSNGIPVAMLQRKMILFQASGVLDHDGQAWLFFAPPRTGKTALALMLKERGYRFFSDKYVFLSLDGGNVLASSFGPSIHIWSPVVEVQKSFSSSDLKQLRFGIPKFCATLKVGYIPHPVPVKGLINVENQATTMLHGPIKPIDSFENLRNAVLFNHMTADMGMEPEIMQMLATLIQQSKLIQLERPKNESSYHELAEYADLTIISGGNNA